MNTSMLLALDLIDNVTAAIGSLLYGLFSIFFSLIDWVQGIFRSLAGLAPIKIDGEIVNAEGSNETYDIVYYLLQTDIIRDIFFSMVIFSIILMFLMVGLSIIRNAYQDKPKPIMSIVGKCFTGMLGILLIPIACLAGLMFGNLILMAVDSATGAGGSQKLSGTLFLSSAYNANRLRNDDIEIRVDGFWELKNQTNIKDFVDSKFITMDKSDLKELEEGEWELLATCVDEAYVSGELTRKNGTVINYGRPIHTKYGYVLMDVNYIVLVVGGVLMLGFIFKMCFGMINRIFKLCVDFVLIPVVMGMLPFDEGPSKAWKKDFISQTTLAYGTVGALNLYFSILPIVDKIELVSGNGAWFNMFFNLALEILGLFAAESMIKTISGWFGTGDLIGEGASSWKKFQDGTKKVMDTGKKVTGKFGGTIAGGISGVKQARKSGGTGFGGFLAGAYGGSGLKGVVDKHLPKGFDDARKAGSEAYDKSRQFGFTKKMKDDRTAEYQGRLKYADYRDKVNKVNQAWARGDYGEGDDAEKIRMANLRELETEFLTAYEANGGTYNINGHQMTAKAALAQKENLEKAATKRETANSRLTEHYKTLKREQDTLESVLSAGVDGALAGNYLTDRSVDISALNDAQQRLLFEAAEAYDEAQNVDEAASMFAAIKAGDASAEFSINGEMVRAADITIQQLRTELSTNAANFDSIYRSLNLTSDRLSELNTNIKTNNADIENIKDNAEQIEKDVKRGRTQRANTPDSITTEQWIQIGKESKK